MTSTPVRTWPRVMLAQAPLLLLVLQLIAVADGHQNGDDCPPTMQQYMAATGPAGPATAVAAPTAAGGAGSYPYRPAMMMAAPMQTGSSLSSSSQQQQQQQQTGDGLPGPNPMTEIGRQVHQFVLESGAAGASMTVANGVVIRGDRAAAASQIVMLPNSLIPIEGGGTVAAATATAIAGSTTRSGISAPAGSAPPLAAAATSLSSSAMMTSAPLSSALSSPSTSPTTAPLLSAMTSSPISIMTGTNSTKAGLNGDWRANLSNPIGTTESMRNDSDMMNDDDLVNNRLDGALLNRSSDSNGNGTVNITDLISYLMDNNNNGTANKTSMPSSRYQQQIQGPSQAPIMDQNGTRAGTATNSSNSTASSRDGSVSGLIHWLEDGDNANKTLQGGGHSSNRTVSELVHWLMGEPDTAPMGQAGSNGTSTATVGTQQQQQQQQQQQAQQQPDSRSSYSTTFRPRPESEQRIPAPAGASTESSPRGTISDLIRSLKD